MADPGFITVSNELQRWTRELKTTQGRDKPPKPDPCLNGREVAENTKGLPVGTVTVPGVTIHGNVLHSIVVNGGQVINGGIVFGGD